MAQVAAAQLGGRPTRQETIHLTLAFLGEVAEARLPEIVRAGAAIKAAAFRLILDRLGFWSHNHLLWAGCSAPPAALRQLVDELRAGLASIGVKVDAGRTDFSPHLSLLRRIPAGAAVAASQPPAVIAPLEWPCHSFVLVRSQLSPAGPDYPILAEFPLDA